MQNNLAAYFEGKFEKPQIYYHITKISNLRSILKQGLIANPKERTYPDGTDNATFGGIYFSKYLNYALNIGADLNNESRLLVICKLTKSSTVHDEDYIINILHRMEFSFSDKLSAVFNIELNTAGQLAAYVYAAYKHNKTLYKQIESIFFEEIRLELNIPDNKKIREKAFSYLLRYAFFYDANYINDIQYGLEQFHNEDNRLLDSDLKEIKSALNQLRAEGKKYIDLITKETRGFSSDGEISRRIIFKDNITFKGNNKIIGIIQLDMNANLTKKITIHYGNKDILKYIENDINLSKLEETIENNKIVFS